MFRFHQKKILKSYFGGHIIDGQTLFTFKKKQENVKYDENVKLPHDFHDGYYFTLVLRSAHSLEFYAGLVDDENEYENKNDLGGDMDYDQVSPERKEQILTFVMQSILSQCGFKFLRMGNTKGWFPANNNESLNHVDTVYKRADRELFRKIGVMRGFSAKLGKSQNGMALKVSNVNKILNSQSLAKEFEDEYYRNPRNWQRNIRSKYEGRKVLYLPQQAVITIFDINFEENEDSTFPSKRDGKEVMISHKDNLLQRKVVNKVEKEQYGLIKDKKGFSFLPQFCHLLFQNELTKKANKDAMEKVRNSVDHELNSVKEFVKHIINIQNGRNGSNENDNNSPKTEASGEAKQDEKDNGDHDDIKEEEQNKLDVLKIIKISPNPYTTNAYPIGKMQISFKTEGGEYINTDEQNVSKQWKNLHEMIETPKEAVRALLVGDNYQHVRKVHEYIDGYLNKRDYSHPVITDIEEYIPRGILDDAFPKELKQRLTADKNKKFGLIILILPSVHDGSRLKRDIHRMCVELGMKSQFVADDPFYGNGGKQRNIVSGMMDDIIYKLGASTYCVHPNLPMKNMRINMQRTMVLGLDVCHPTNTSSKNMYDRPSIAVLTSLYGGDIMAPNVKHQKNCMYLNNNRVEICGYKQMLVMMMNVIQQQLLRDDISEPPQAIWMMRDGVSDSQMAAMVSKEMTALLCAVRKVKLMKEIKQKYSNIKSWKPKYEWLVIQKRILDRFAVKNDDKNRNYRDNNHRKWNRNDRNNRNDGNNNMRLGHSSPAFIIPQHIVSGQYFEYYFQIGRRLPRKIIFVRDDLKLRDGALMDVARFIYAQHWLYPPCVPFSMGPLGYPVSVKFADHYASMWQDFIGAVDDTLEGLISSPDLHYPQVITLLKDKNKNEDNDNKDKK